MRSTFTAGLGAILILASTARAEEPVPADSAATPEDALSDYLDDLAGGTEEAFGEDVFSISDTEIDSLVRVYEETGRSPYDEAGIAGRAQWGFDFGIDGLRYNRVEGLNVVAKGSLSAPTSRPLEAFGKLGYAWALEKGTWLAGVRGRLANRGGAPTVEVNYGRRVPAYGAGDVPGNSMTALFLGEDYGDYYLSDRWSFWFQLSPGKLRVDLNYRIEEQESLRKQTDRTLFDKNVDFRANPPIEDGKARLLRLLLGAGNADSGALAADLEAVVAGREFGGDFEYESLLAELTGRRTIWFGDQVTLKASGGVASGDTPPQALHHLGGFRRLRGYEINEIGARQFAHLGLDYKIGTDFLRFVPFVNRLGLQIAPFVDGAAVFERQATGGVVIKPDSPEFRFSGGIGIQKNLLGIPGGSGQLRLDVARRLDRGDDTMTYRMIITAGR